MRGGWPWMLWMVACGGEPAPDADPGTDPQDSDPVEETPAVETDTPSDTPAEDSDTVPPDPCMVEASQLVVGTGERDFRAITPGQELAVVHGPQGGWHYWGAVSVVNAPEFVRIRLDIVDVASGLTLHGSDVNARLKPLTGDTWACDGTYTGILGVLTLPEALLPDPTCNDDGPPPGQVGPWEDPTPCATVPEVLCNHEIQMTYRVTTPSGDLVGEESTTVNLLSDPVVDPPCPVAR